jgi:hypothetical protein
MSNGLIFRAARLALGTMQNRPVSPTRTPKIPGFTGRTSTSGGNLGEFDHEPVTTLRPPEPVCGKSVPVYL